MVPEGTSLAYQCKGIMSSFHYISSNTVGHDGSTLHNPPGDFPFIYSPQIVRENSPPCPPTFDFPVSNITGKHLEQVDRHLVPPSVLIGGEASQAIPLYAPHMPLWNTPNRSICNKRKCSGPPLSLAFLSDSCERPRRICRELEPMVSHLPFPSSTNSNQGHDLLVAPKWGTQPSARTLIRWRPSPLPLGDQALTTDPVL